MVFYLPSPGSGLWLVSTRVNNWYVSMVSLATLEIDHELTFPLPPRRVRDERYL